MAERRDIHVVPSDDKWAVRRENDNDPVSTHATQAEAEQAGRTLAQRESSELLVHGKDGQIRDRSTYGNDPRNVPG
jgi:hypothetical protein